MRDLFFKTTQARHPSALLRFVYSFLRLRNQAVFFVRPRSRFSLFFRLQVLRKMFVWFYTDRFARRSFFQKLVRARTGTFRTFLNFCTTLETYLPVILYRFRFTESMRDSFYALQAGRVFCNGALVRQRVAVMQLGDFVEVLNVDAFKIFGFRQLIRCLPTLRFRLTLKDSIVNTAIFYAMFVRNYSFFSSAERYVPISFDLDSLVARLPYLNDQYKEPAFFSFFLSRIFLSLFRCNSLLRLWVFRKALPRLGVKPTLVNRLVKPVARRAGHLWWYAPGLLFGRRRLKFSLGWRRNEAQFLPGIGHLFGGLQNMERDVANVPNFVQNALGSRYVFSRGKLVVR